MGRIVDHSLKWGIQEYKQHWRAEFIKQRYIVFLWNQKAGHYVYGFEFNAKRKMSMEKINMYVNDFLG